MSLVVRYSAARTSSFVANTYRWGKSKSAGGGGFGIGIGVGEAEKLESQSFYNWRIQCHPFYYGSVTIRIVFDIVSVYSIISPFRIYYRICDTAPFLYYYSGVNILLCKNAVIYGVGKNLLIHHNIPGLYLRRQNFCKAWIERVKILLRLADSKQLACGSIGNKIYFPLIKQCVSVAIIFHCSVSDFCCGNIVRCVGMVLYLVWYVQITYFDVLSERRSKVGIGSGILGERGEGDANGCSNQEQS